MCVDHQGQNVAQYGIRTMNFMVLSIRKILSIHKPYINPGFWAILLFAFLGNVVVLLLGEGNFGFSLLIWWVLTHSLPGFSYFLFLLTLTHSHQTQSFSSHFLHFASKEEKLGLGQFLISNYHKLEASHFIVNFFFHFIVKF